MPVQITLSVEPFHGTSGWMARERLARTNVVIVGSRETRAGSLPAVDVEAIFSDADGETRLVQRYTSDAGLGFVLTCSSEAGWFERVRPACALALGTFRVRP